MDEPGPGRVSRQSIAAAIVIFVSFFVFAAVRAPVPGVNEPHYLSKAKHYWNPDWCSGDLFLESSNPHRFFYQAVGWPTLWLSLEQTAWLGRWLALGVLALGWTALGHRLLHDKWAVMCSAWIYLLLAAIGNLSGEWIVGGVESKVFAFGLLLLGGALALDGAWNRAAIASGLAIAFHPLVGVWGVVAASIATLPAIVRRSGTQDKRVRTHWTRNWRPLLLLLLCALPGLLPALSVVGNGSAAADRVQVFERLSHHLDPMTFRAFGYIWYGLLIVCWLVAGRFGGNDGKLRTFDRFVWASLLIAAVGFIAGFGPRPPEQMPLFEFRMTLLKFYPFRLFDAVLPIAVALTLTNAVRGRPAGASTSFRRRLVWCVAALGLLASLVLPAVDRNPSRMSPHQLSDWIDACRWIESETSRDALIVTPRESWAFKWYAQRAEYFSYKDCPQDAPALLEWTARRVFLGSWIHPPSGRSYSIRDLRVLHTKSAATFLMTADNNRLPIVPAYRNDSFAVYRLEAESQ